MKNIFLIGFILFSFNVFATESKKITLNEWNNLDGDEQGHILREALDSYEGFEELEFEETDLPPEFQQAYQASKNSAQPVLDALEFDDNHARVGPPRVIFITLYKLEGALVGMNLGFSFKGCDLPDLTSSYFEDEKSAVAAGCDFSDVSWLWTGTFDAKGDLIYDPYYAEWTGY